MNFSRLGQVALAITLTFSLSTISFGATADNQETRSMQIESVEGSECPMTGARVETVTAMPELKAQKIVVSIPRDIVAERPNLRLYKIDASKFAFDDYQELRSGKNSARRSFALVVRESEKFQFKVGFNSAQ